MNGSKSKQLLAHNAALAAYFDDLLAPEKKRIVFGDGDPRARIVLIGEAPGEQEALLGKPFVGKAGKILDEFLEKTGLKREDLYITNVVKWRPTAVSKAGRTINRAPNREELALFLPWLQKELKLLQPAYIVTLGNTPLRAVSGLKSAVIGQYHGRMFPGGAFGAHFFPLYHPAAVIYNRSLRDTYLADLAAFAALLRRG